MVSPEVMALVLGVVPGALPIDEYDWLVAHDPGIVASGQRRDLARADVKLGAIRHDDVDAARHVVLEMCNLAPFSPGSGLYVF
jgi:hypothetical protein